MIITLFLKYTPYNKQKLQTLSNTTYTTFLPQTFLNYTINNIFNIKFLQNIKNLTKNLNNITINILTYLNLNITPIFTIIINLILHNFKLLPTFITTYNITFLIK